MEGRLHKCKGITKAVRAPPHNSVECGKGRLIFLYSHVVLHDALLALVPVGIARQRSDRARWSVLVLRLQQLVFAGALTGLPRQASEDRIEKQPLKN